MVGGLAAWGALRWVLTCWCELGPAMLGCRNTVVLGLGFTCWWVGLGPRVSGSCPLVCDTVPEASAGSLVGRVMSCGPASAFWVGDWGLGPGPCALWWTALCPRQAVGSGSLVVSCW